MPRHALRIALEQVAPLLASATLLLVADGMLSTTVSVRLEQHGLRAATTGAVLSSYYLGLLVGARHGYRVIARAGSIRAFSVFAATMACTAIGHHLFPSPIAWAPLRAIAGFSMAGLYTTIESWLNERAEAATRGTILALYVGGLQVGLTTAYLLFALGESLGLELFELAAIFFCVAFFPVVLSRSTEPSISHTPPAPVGEIFRLSPIGIAGSATAGLLLASFFTMGPVTARRIGLDGPWTGLFMAALALGGALLQWPIGILSDRMERTRVLFLSLAGVTLTSTWLYALADASPWLLALPALAWGGFAFSIYPLSVAVANDYVSPADRVSAAGGLLFAYGAGCVLAPNLAGTLIQTASAAGLFVFWLLVGSVSAGFLVYRWTQRTPLPASLQVAYQPVPRTTPVGAHLDPRAEEPATLVPDVPAAEP